MKYGIHGLCPFDIEPPNTSWFFPQDSLSSREGVYPIVTNRQIANGISWAPTKPMKPVWENGTMILVGSLLIEESFNQSKVEPCCVVLPSPIKHQMVEPW